MYGTTTTFPTTYAAIPTANLIAAYAAGPARLRQALHGLVPEDMRQRPRAAKWSILETALHVTDSDVVGAGRIRLALAQPGEAFYAYDQVRWVRTLGHQDADRGALERALAVLDAVRAWTLPLLARATPAQWAHTAVHPEFGAVTLRNLLELYADHVERHVAQVLECRRLLLRPLTLPPILEPRLY